MYSSSASNNDFAKTHTPLSVYFGERCHYVFSGYLGVLSFLQTNPSKFVAKLGPFICGNVPFLRIYIYIYSMWHRNAFMFAVENACNWA